MGKKITVWMALMFMFSLPPDGFGSVQNGRDLLSHTNSPTYADLSSANALFEDVVQGNLQDTSYQEANFFYALTRLMASAIETGSSSNIQTIRDLLERCGRTFDLARDIYPAAGSEFQPPFDIPETDDHYASGQLNISGEELRAFWAGPFVQLIDACLENLGRIDVDFEFSDQWILESGYSGKISADLEPGIYRLEAQDFQGAAMTFQTEYPGPVALPEVTGLTYSWIGADLALQWEMPTTGLPDPANQPTQFRPSIEVIDHEGWTVGGLYGRVSTDAGVTQMLVPARVVRMLRQAGTEFRYNFHVRTGDGTNRTYSDAISADLTNTTYGTVAGSVTTIVGGGVCGVDNAVVTIVGTGQSAVTDASGRYVFPDVITGTYTLNVDAPGLNAISVFGVAVAGSGLTTAVAPLVLDNNGVVLQADLEAAVASERAKYDPSGDGTVGLEEAIRALQVVSGAAD